jgi:hypothetical protein
VCDRDVASAFVRACMTEEGARYRVHLRKEGIWSCEEGIWCQGAREQLCADCGVGQMLEASTEFPQTAAVFSLISPGKKEVTQSVSMMLTTRPEDVTDLFVDKLTPVLLENGRREQEVSEALKPCIMIANSDSICTWRLDSECY